jgi:hypothetical protein
MTTDAELVALLVRVDRTGLSLSAKASWRRDFAALRREVRVRAAHRSGMPPRRSRPHTPRFQETASVLILGRGGRYRHEQPQPRGKTVTVAGCDGETSWEQEYKRWPAEFVIADSKRQTAFLIQCSTGCRFTSYARPSSVTGRK